MSDNITVCLKIISAHELIKRSILKNPDPFAQILFNNQICKTNTYRRSINPVWNKSFTLKLQSLKDRLEIIIWNQRFYDKKKSCAFLGSVILSPDLIDSKECTLKLSRNSTYQKKSVRGFIKIEMNKLDYQVISSHISIPQMFQLENLRNSRRSINFEDNHLKVSRDRSISTNQFQTRPGPSSKPIDSLVLPANFERKVSDGGKVYFIDIISNSVHWYHPSVPKYIRKIGNFSCLGPLPNGWDSLQSDSGKIYFIDHISKTTQFTDPRLLHYLAEPDGLSTVLRKLQDAGHVIKCQSGCSAKMERSRSDHRKTKNVPPQESMHDTVVFSPIVNTHENTVPESSQIAYRSQSSSQIPNFSFSLIDSESSTTKDTDDNAECNNELAPLPLQRRRISRPTSNYVLMNKIYIDMKLKDLRSKLKELMQKKLCIIETSRDNILEESFTAIKRLKSVELRRRLVVKFTDEEGLDYGGVAREWLYLLSETLFSCRHGLFETNGDAAGNLLQVSPLCWVNENHLQYFHFIGRIIGLAIFHGYYLDADFCKIFYKSILNRQPKLEDFKELDEAIYNSLSWMLVNNIDDADLNLTFSVEQEVFGELQTIDLCENGRNIPVTDNVKNHYIDRYVEYNLVEKCSDQYSYIKKGIYEVLPFQSLDNLNEDEFEVLLTGVSEIRIEDWQKNTRLKHCVEGEPLIKWFWEVVTSYTEQQRTKLLQFVTGSSRIPLSGFEGLRGSYGTDEPKLFTIKVIRNGNSQSLPKAHTCFNRLDLPPYTSYKCLEEKLTCAIEETCGFAVM